MRVEWYSIIIEDCTPEDYEKLQSLFEHTEEIEITHAYYPMQVLIRTRDYLLLPSIVQKIEEEC